MAAREYGVSITTEIGRLDPVDQKFEAVGTVKLAWRTQHTIPSTREPGSESQEEDSEEPESVPFATIADECPVSPVQDYLFLNASRTTFTSAASATYDRKTGTVTAVFEYETEVGVEMRLDRFPFDRQLLHLQLYNSVDVGCPITFRHLVPGKGTWCCLLGSLRTEWELGVPFVRTVRHEDQEGYANEGSGSVHLFVPISRIPHYFVMKVVFPIFFIVTSLTPAWAMSITDFPDRMGVACTLILTSVAFKYIVGGFLPKTPYLTLMDKYVLLSFVYQFIGLAAMTLSYVLLTNQAIFNSSVSFPSPSSSPSSSASSSDPATSEKTQIILDIVAFGDRWVAVAFGGIWILIHLLGLLVAGCGRGFRRPWEHVFEDWVRDARIRNREFYRYAASESDPAIPALYVPKLPDAKRAGTKEDMRRVGTPGRASAYVRDDGAQARRRGLGSSALEMVQIPDARSRGSPPSQSLDRLI